MTAIVALIAEVIAAVRDLIEAGGDAEAALRAALAELRTRRAALAAVESDEDRRLRLRQMQENDEL